jgi:alpha-glucosidase (family GH31 glycosyl hydrolase)
MAQAVGIDPASNEPVPFDIASEKIARAYLEILHHPLEKQGVDFWWIDWQQGTRTKKEGLDPLYALNELHYYDLGRNPEKRPFIFSRWPGLGGHR